MRRSSLVPVVAVIAALFLGAPCRSGELRPVEPRPAPALALTDLSGAARSLADWRGKVVLVNFWAAWCPPCIAEMPSMQRAADRLRGQPFAVVTVNVAEAERRAAQAMERLGLDLPVLLDADGATFRAWGGKGLPTSALVDGAGRLRYVGLGPLEWDGADAMTAIQELLSEMADGE